MDALKGKPNLEAVLKGCTSGAITEWPMIREELRDLLQDNSGLREQLERAQTSLPGQTCFVPPEFQAELDEWKQRAEKAEAKSAALKQTGKMAIDRCEEQRRALDLLLLESIIETKQHKQRAEAAEARIEAGTAQKRDVWLIPDKDMATTDAEWASGNSDMCEPRYAIPAPLVDVQELQRQLAFWKNSSKEWRAGHKRLEGRITELVRELAGQQAINHGRKVIGWIGRHHNFISLPEQASKHDTPVFSLDLERPNKQLDVLLAQAEEKGRKLTLPDGWQSAHIRQYLHNDGSGFVAAYDKDDIDAMLAITQKQNPMEIKQ